jgi:hypothetical protein
MRLGLLCIAGCCALSLAGCATPAEVVSETTPIKLISSLDPQALANCIVRNGEEIYSGISGSVQSPGGQPGRTDVLLRSGQNPAVVVHISATERGSIGSLYLGRILLLMPETYTTLLMTGCQ